jgi:putative two-component system response regulator
MRKPTIMVVDDESINLAVLCGLFTQKNNVRAFKSGEAALNALKTDSKPDLILMDVVMPGMDGFQTLSIIHENPDTRDIPVMFITSLDSPADEDTGFRLGAVDYITKPFKPSAVLARVSAQLELKETRDRLKDQNRWLEAEVEKRTMEVRLTEDASLNALMCLAETRDDNTGNHLRRTYRYVETLATEMKSDPKYARELSDDRIRSIARASRLHDIGKIGIPDHILRKPGKLTKEEFEVIKTHCELGAGALRSAKREAMTRIPRKNTSGTENALLFLDEAEVIARSHHEKWDGNGYPEGKMGAEIPLSARLMALADVFDALTTERPYKAAWTMEEAAAYIIGQRGRAFDPDVVEAFQNRMDDFRKIMRDFADAGVREE